VNVGCVITTDSDEVQAVSPIVNPTIGAGTAIDTGTEELAWRERVVAFASQNQRYRVAYMGVTGHHDASALTNTGMLGVAQYPVMFEKISTGTVPTMDNKGKQAASSKNEPNLASFGFARPAYSCIDMYKTWEQMQQSPNAYLSEAKFGFYAPYRLSHTCQKWRNARALMPYLDNWNYTPMDPQDHGVSMGCLAFAGLEKGFPFGELPYANDDTTVDHSNVTWPSYVVENCDEGVIHVSARNLTPQASFNFMIRMGIETQVAPGSPLCPFMKLPPPHDALALDGYFAICRELKDAYPEAYNGWGEILKPIAEAAADALQFIPGIGKGVAAAAHMAIPLISKVAGGLSTAANRPTKKGSKTGADLSMGAKEKVRQQLALRAMMKQRAQAKTAVKGKNKKRKLKFRKPKGKPGQPWSRNPLDAGW